jgi:pSer/pThr/pTyr-binding forkhead associated (FHA) protein
MILCERCGTESADGSRYCDECGAALWLAGKSSSLSMPGAQGNGSDGRGRNDSPATVARLPGTANSPLISEQQTPTPLVVSGGRVHATLVIERGNSAGKQFPLRNQEANIGRWDADGGVFPDVDLDSDDPEAKVSRRHARISLRDGQYQIEDLGSTNGTFVNRGHRLTPGDRQPLKDGDEIIVGKTFLRFRVTK